MRLRWTVLLVLGGTACADDVTDEGGRAAMSDDTWGDELSEPSAPDEQGLDVGRPCEQNECLDDWNLEICSGGIVVGEVDCATNEGTCEVGGQEPHCKPDGWDCRTGCLDETRRQICWADLSVTVVDCSELVDGLYCNDGDEADDSCGREPPTRLLSDEPAADPDDGPDPPAGEDDAPADDSQAADDPPPDDETPVEEEPPPDGDLPDEAPADWLCDPSYYGTFDGCDCDCGLPDPDCDDPDQEVYGCDEWQWCIEGECVD